MEATSSAKRPLLPSKVLWSVVHSKAPEGQLAQEETVNSRGAGAEQEESNTQTLPLDVSRKAPSESPPEVCPVGVCVAMAGVEGTQMSHHSAD